MNNTAQNGYHGTKTQENLRIAAENEAQAHTKYIIYAEFAEKNGNISAAKKFSEFAENEKEHTELWLNYLGEINTAEENLENVIISEKFEAEEFYPNAAKIADEEGFAELAGKFRKAGTVEARHAKEFSKILEEIENPGVKKYPADTEWLCSNCGYSVKGNIPPEYCPLCSYPQNYFETTCL